MQKLAEISNAAANRASQIPGTMRVCAENQTERLAEAVGRVTVSTAMAGVLQRYPLLERWRLAFLRGRECASQGATVASAPPGRQSGTPEEPLLAELPLFDAGDDKMEDVPLGEAIDQEEEDAWEKAR
jgi:hypothetical protein